MVADDIIGTLGMENKTIKGTIDKRAVQTVVVVVKLLLNGPPKYTN
jgi:hypothetical protein